MNWSLIKPLPNAFFSVFASASWKTSSDRRKSSVAFITRASFLCDIFCGISGIDREKQSPRTMPSGMEIFTQSGPSHLTAVDWKNPHHRRAIAASLVEGAYRVERDRQQNLQGHEALAPPWWEFFHFQVSHVLIDDVDHSIFGVVYESKFPASYFNHSQLKAPRYVMAFRGTLTQPDTRSRDLRLDFRCISNRLHESSRFQLAMQSIKNMVSLAGAGNVWLAGHSLGSAIALQAGKSMTKMGFPLETYLFNPPFISAPTERIKEERLKHGIHIASSVVKAGLSHVVKSRNSHNTTKEDDDPFVVLASWSPYLFLNPADHICSGYIGYFEQRKKMEEIGAGKIERLAIKNSIESMFSGALGKETEPFNFLPSAIVTINQTPASDFRRAHGVEQWWNPNFHYRSIMFQFSN